MEIKMERQSIFTLNACLNGWLCFLMGVLSLLVNLEWYLSVLLFADSLVAFSFCFMSRRGIVFPFREELFLTLFYVVMLPGGYIITKLAMSELPIYFLLGLIFTAVILEGRRKTVLLTAELAADCGAIWYVIFYTADGIYDAGAVTGLMYIRLLIAVVAAGFAGGVLLKYRNDLLTARIRNGRERSEAAEKANQVRDSFMANVSHEINAPLQTITETTQALLALDLDIQRKEDLYYIDNTARNMLSVSNALFEFALKGREESGRKENSEKIYKDIVKNINHAADQEEQETDYSTEKFICPEATVMVVDDNVINMEILNSMLEPYGCRVLDASGGAECLELLERERVDLIFLDYMMPEMDGMETLRRLRDRKDSLYASVPVIALTANSISGAKEMFLEGGFNAYMTKPVEIRMLRQMLRQFLPEAKIRMVSTDDRGCNDAGKQRITG